MSIRDQDYSYPGRLRRADIYIGNEPFPTTRDLSYKLDALELNIDLLQAKICDLHKKIDAMLRSIE